MAGLARVTIPGTPHHLTQRGNGRQQTFFSEDDYTGYLDLMADWRGFLALSVEEAMLTTFRRHERAGRPLGDAAFLARLERLLDRPLRPRKPGRPRKKEKK